MTGNCYVISDSKCWADEFNVYFFEILSDKDYELFKTAKEVLGYFHGSLWFGSNQGWEYDFDFLDFEPMPLTDEEVKVLSKVGVFGEDIMYRFIDQLADKFEEFEITTENPYDMSIEDFRKACQELRLRFADYDEE